MPRFRRRAHQIPAPTPRARTQLIHTPPNNHRSLQRQKHLCNGENAQRGTRSAIRLCCDDCDTLASGVATSKGRFEDSLRDDSQVNETEKNIANFFFFSFVFQRFYFYVFSLKDKQIKNEK